MLKRVLTAAVLLPPLWLLLKRAPAPAFQGLVAAVTLAAAWECYRLVEALGFRPFKILGLAACFWVGVSFVAPGASLGPVLPLVAGAVLATAAAMRWRSDPAAMLGAAAGTLFPVLFVGLAMAHVVALRALPGEDGTDLPLLLLFCIMIGDTAALLFGRWLGRRPLARVLSPKKTWEGAAAGLAATVGAALLARVWFYRRLPLGHAIAIGVMLAVAGALGDLAESMVKRAAGAKDSSTILPGHGGFLDRTDSLLFSGPALYYYYRLFLEAAR